MFGENGGERKRTGLEANKDKHKTGAFIKLQDFFLWIISTKFKVILYLLYLLFKILQRFASFILNKFAYIVSKYRTLALKYVQLYLYKWHNYNIAWVSCKIRKTKTGIRGEN